MNHDTIAAIATALSDSGIGIIRISGDDSIKIANKLFQDKKGEHSLSLFPSHTIHYGFIYYNDELIDEVMISVMKAPNSFTRENIVEINCHGGVFVCKKILDCVLLSGARLAEPGEFTKRAFLNGRIDLSKAEAVMDVIASQNSMALKNSLKHLNGKLYDTIKELRESLIYEVAFIESALDDPEHISLFGYTDRLLHILDGCEEKVSFLCHSFERGKLLRSGIETVIVGKPNVGKSSLLNQLTGQNRAIVTEIAGTTRDVITETISLNGFHLNLTDTAGIRDTDDVVEHMGVEKACEYAKDADLVLFLLDKSCPIEEEDRKIASLVRDKKCIVLLNKADKQSILSKEDVLSLFDTDVLILEISAKEGTGMKELEKMISSLFFKGSFASNDDLMITNLRHVEELRKVLDSISHVKESISLGLPEDFYSIDLMSAYQALGRIIGEEVDDDLVTEIFTKFCMGK